MTHIALYKAITFDELHKTPDSQNRVATLGILADILGQHYLNGADEPTPGDRLPEFQHSPTTATFDHGGGTTHHRPGPWQITRVEEYPCNTGTEDYEGIYLCHCIYAPLPETENPWVEMPRAIVSPDSFGGDLKAYQQWQETQEAIPTTALGSVSG